MPETVAIDPSADLTQFRLPAAVDARLQTLLDRQDAGHPLSPDELAEAEGLADVADLLTLLRLRTEGGRERRPGCVVPHYPVGMAARGASRRLEAGPLETAAGGRIMGAVTRV